MTLLNLSEQAHAQGYYLDPLDPDVQLDGVTTALKRGLPPYLVEWAARLAAQRAVNEVGSWYVQGYDPGAAIDWIRRAPDDDRDQAGDKGTVVHRVLDHAASGTVPDERFEPAVAGYINAGLRFLHEWRPSFVWNEVTVFGPGYGGTLDFIAEFNHPDLAAALGIEGRPVRLIGDYKTSRRVYPEVAVQLAAYRYASHAIDSGPDGLTPVAVPEVDGAIVVHIKGDGTYEVRPVDATGHAYEVFLRCLDIVRWKARTDVMGAPLDHPPVPRTPMLTAPPEAAQDRRSWLRSRIEALLPLDGAEARLLAWWPQGTPGLGSDHAHTDAELDTIAEVVSAVEADLGQPFPPTGDPGKVTSKASEDDVASLRARLGALPADLLDNVQAEAVTHGITVGLGARTTTENVTDLDRILSMAEETVSARMEQVEAIMDGVEVWEPVTTAAQVADVESTTATDVEHLDAVAAAVRDGYLTDVGDGVLGVTDEAAKIISGVVFANKRDALNAAKRIAKAEGLSVPPKFDDAVASPLLVALLVRSAGPTTDDSSAN